MRAKGSTVTGKSKWFDGIKFILEVKHSNWAEILEFGQEVVTEIIYRVALTESSGL